MVIFHSYVSLPEGIHKTIILKDWIVFVILFFVVIFSRLFCLIFCLFFAVRSLGFVHLILYIYMFEIQCKQNEALDYTMRSCDGPNVSWLFQFQCSWWQGYIMFPVMMVVIMPS